MVGAQDMNLRAKGRDQLLQRRRPSCFVKGLDVFVVPLFFDVVPSFVDEGVEGGGVLGGVWGKGLAAREKREKPF